jgi:hypothetical protein
MRVTFMYDGHTFAGVGDSSVPREKKRAEIISLFGVDGCGCVFARDSRGDQVEPLHGSPQPDGHYGVTEAEVDAFLDRVDEHENWEARG